VGRSDRGRSVFGRSEGGITLSSFDTREARILPQFMRIAATQTRSSLVSPSIPSPVALHVRDYARTTFAPRHRAVLRAFAEALFFDESAPFGEGRLDALVDDCDDFVSRASKTLRFGLRFILDAIRWLPLLVVHRFSTFEELPLPVRVTMLERMDRGVAPLPLMLVAYKTILAMLFFEAPKELLDIGYPGPARERWKRGLPMAESERAP
jgi:hypothetical protein